MPEHQSDRTVCSRCGQTGSKKLHKCSQCHSITYCGQECQKKDWERHKHNCFPVMVTEVKGKGRGLVAARDIKTGQVILTDEAAVTLKIQVGEELRSLRDVESFIMKTIQSSIKSVTKQVGNMSKERQSQFYNLRCYGSRSMSHCKEMEIFIANASPDEEKDTKHLFLNLSLINHSCAPNSAWCYKDSSESIVIGPSRSNVLKAEYAELAKYLCMGTAVYALLSNWSVFWQLLTYIMTLFLKLPVPYLCLWAFVYIMLEDWCIIWKVLSFLLINHIYSELKSRWESRRLLSKPRKKLEVRAIKNIRKGEEITLCYLEYDQNLGSKHQMKKHLKREFKFDCKCSVCTGGKLQSI